MDIADQQVIEEQVIEQQVREDAPLDMSKTNPNLFNNNGQPRQRAQKIYRKNMSENEWQDYQRMKANERCLKYRQKKNQA
jgi:hypothetical protein